MKAAIAILTALLCVLAQPLQAGVKPHYTIYLTAKTKGGIPLAKPAKEFACSDRIYTVIEIRHPGDTRTHVLSATWRNPSGADQEHTRYGFRMVNGTARVWVWLKLHRSTAASIASFANPSAGYDEFVGRWQILIEIDGKRIAKKKFNVLC